MGKDAREPYRAFLIPIIEKLDLTAALAKQELERLQSDGEGRTITSGEKSIALRPLMPLRVISVLASDSAKDAGRVAASWA